jgi:hypothetical protein
MTTHMKMALIAAAAALTLTAAPARAQSTAPEHEHGAPPAAQGAAMGHQAMMASMQAAQKKLDDLVAQMNTATGPEKVEKIAAVVNEIAAMHTRMQAMMMRCEMMHGAAAPTPPQ